MNLNDTSPNLFCLSALITLLVVAFLIFSSPCLLGQTSHTEGIGLAIQVEEEFEMPDTPVGRCASAYFKAFNSRDDHEMQAFLKQYKTQEDFEKRSMEERIQQYHELLEEMKAVNPLRVVHSAEKDLTLMVGDSLTGTGWEYRFQLSEDASQKLAFIMIKGPIDLEGGACCTPILPEDAPKVDGATRAKIIDKVCEVLNEHYVFPDVAKEMEVHARNQLKEGAYDNIEHLELFTAQLTQDFLSICHDLHLHIFPEIRPPDEEQTEEEQKQVLEDKRYTNFGFYRVERLPGNIGYLDLRRFSEARDAGFTAIATMNFLAFCDALIVDLRKNPGGSPSLIQLISSYFFDETVHLNSFYIREGDKTQQFWTQAQVEGPRLTHVPIYVLVSGNTASGAEEFSYNLKNLERATIIGETTAGAAHPCELHPIPEVSVTVKVPFGRAVNPISGTNWEGKGVEPHIRVPASEALEVARIEAMKKLLEQEMDEKKKGTLQWLLKTLEVKRKPVSLLEGKLKEYEGTFGPVKTWVEKGCLVHKRPGVEKYISLPLGDDKFMLKDRGEHVQFIRDKAGKVMELQVHFEEGRMMRFPRAEG